MTETMLEQLTRAIWTQLPQDDANMAASGRIARAALEAIRKVDNETAWALATASGTRNRHRAAQDFTAMIDAILSQSQEGR